MGLGLEFIKFNFKEITISMVIILTLSLIGQASQAANTRPSHYDSCKYELGLKGYFAPQQQRFCQLTLPYQWTCMRFVLGRFYSLELAKDTCLNATARESDCVSRVLARNYDPYVAKRVCRLR